MNGLTEYLVHVVVIGVGATAVMDTWLWFLKRLHVPTLNFAFIGRWVGNGCRGQWMHDSIAKAAPIKGELALGWGIHYATGIVFAGLLVSIYGSPWISNPRLLPALAIGIGTVAIPLFVMQPAMGAGIASSRTPTPVKNCVRSLANHAVFGLGLYIAAAGTAWMAP